MHVSRGEILRTCTKAYKNTSERFDSDYKIVLIMLVIPLNSLRIRNRGGPLDFKDGYLLSSFIRRKILGNRKILYQL